MPQVDSQGVSIHYQVEGEGPPLLLHHGAMSNLASWIQCGYVRALRLDFQCILIDARGHGESDKPHSAAAYSLRSYVDDLRCVLDALGLDSVHYWGYSMGGWIGFCMAKLAPERLKTLIIGAAHAFEDSRLAAFGGVDCSDPDRFIAAVEELMGEKVAPEWRPLMLANDLQAIAAAMQKRPSLEDILPTMAMPCLLYAGAEDSRHAEVKASASRIAGATFHSFPALNHAQCMLRSPTVLPVVRAFLAQHVA